MADPIFREFRLRDSANQKQTAIILGRRCTLRFRFNPTLNRWTFDLRIGDEDVLFGRRIVLGVDLLQPFNFGIGGMIAVSLDGSEPDYAALVERRVRFYSVEEIG